MQKFSISALERTADASLREAQYPAGKMGLVYALPLVALELLLIGATLLIQKWMSGLSGLSGMSTVSMLDTAQVVVSLLPVLMTPFWYAGYTKYVLDTVNHQPTEARTILSGFRLWTKVLGMTLLFVFCVASIGYLLYFFASMIFLSVYFLGRTDQLMEIAKTQQLPDGLLGPMMGIMAVAFLVSYLLFFYRYRLMYFSLFSDPALPNLLHLRRCRMLMRGRTGAFFLLDLHFWWYWLLRLLSGALLQLDLILALLNVSVPLSPVAQSLLCIVLWGAAELAIDALAMGKVWCTYTAAYLAAAASQPQPVRPAQQQYRWQ